MTETVSTNKQKILSGCGNVDSAESRKTYIEKKILCNIIH